MKLRFCLTTAFLLLLWISLAQADSFFVSNFGINTITRYDESGNGSLFTNSFVHGPTGIALDASGNVYVATQSNTIEKFAPNGSILGVFASTGLSNPLGLAFNRAGHLFAANFDSNSVEEFAADGTDLGVFAAVSQPTGLAFDASGNLHVASSSNVIRRFAPNGTALSRFTSAALQNPTGLAFDSLGVLYVANNASNAIETFSPTGTDLGPARQVFTAAAPVLPNDEQQVYINFRTDGVAGTGNRVNPLDGSTQAKLDAIFKSFYDVGTTNITFHLGPGTFHMKGAWDYDWAMLTGWHIKGAGRSLTIVKQVVGAAGVNPGSNGALFSNGAALTFDNQSVEDLTCDCAWFRSGPGGDNSRPHGNFQGVNLYGANPTIRNVTVTGCGWQDNECFAILTSGGVNDKNLPDNALYENVEVSGGGAGIYRTHLTGMAMINLAAMGNDPTPVFAKNGRIINCTFNLPNAGNAGGPPGGYDSGVVTGCTFIGYWHGIFYDTFVSKNITIAGNTIKALFPDSNGILFNSGATNASCDNITIVGNTIFAANGVAFASAVKNSTILGNKISRAPGTNADSSFFLDTATVKNIKVAQNSVDADFPYLNRGTTGCTFISNRTPAGDLAVPDTGGASNDVLGYESVPAVAGLSGPTGLAFDRNDQLHVVNSLSATVAESFGDATEGTVVTTGSSPSYIAVQRSPRLANISTRVKILAGDNVLAGGFIVSGPGTKKVLIRGLGPSLAAAGVEGALADPTLELHDGSPDAILASNDNWRDTQQTVIAASGIAPSINAEATIIATLSAGTYTVIERGKNNTTGVGLIEIYDLETGTGPELANISSRGFVDTADNVMIAGFIAASATGGTSQVMLRALGPSLGAAGVSNPLANPVLELHDSNGALVASNDNWMSDQKSEIVATGIAPTHDNEAALLATLIPGTYTAIESGKSGGTGVGLIEVYNLH
ncbi:MAG: hypothetical protein H0X40_09195 [Chthoniobacterales bacterium]|nr:hypothetical protein [Chthoniobacterales bacterium]